MHESVFWGALLMILVSAPAGADQAERQRKINLRAQPVPAQLVKGKPRRDAVGKLFQAAFAPNTEQGAIPLGKMQSWKFTVKTATGEPLRKAQITLRGFMPQHAHGFSTAPEVQEIAPGVYEASGLKFHMPGWWVLDLAIVAGTEAETLEFQILL